MYFKVIISILIVILIVLILFGNFFVMVVFCFCKELRIIINYFFFLLSFVDLFMVLFVMLIFMVLKIIRDGSFFFGGVVFYDVWWLIDIICGIVFIWNLCLVSLDRLFVVVVLFRYLVIVILVSVKVVIVLVWISFLSFLGIFYMNWNYKGIFIIFISFFLLLFIIIFLYVKIY